MSRSNKRVLVTGGAGFLGSHIVDRCLLQGDSVRVLARPSSDLTFLQGLPGVTIELGDLTSPEALSRATRGIDVVYHSAARVTEEGTRAEFYAANVGGTRELLKSARLNGVRRFVFVSSPSVVAEDADQGFIDESYPYPSRYLNLYSETKAIAERLVLLDNRETFVTCAIRPRGVWGPRDKTGFVPKLVAKLLDSKLPDLSGGREVWVSLCHCDNAADACVQAAESDRVGGNAYFVTDAETTDLWQFVRELSALFNVPPPRSRLSPVVARVVAKGVAAAWKVPCVAKRRAPPITPYAVALLTRMATYDTRAAERDFGYRARVSQRQGLLELKRWVDSVGGIPKFIEHVR